MPSPRKNSKQGSVEDLICRLADAECRLDGLAREVEHLQRLAMVGTIAAGVIHEINNQLTPALAQAQLARLRPDDRGTLLKAVDSSIRGMTRAGRIAETLVDFASADSDAAPDDGRPPRRLIHPPAANIGQAVKATLECVGSGIKQRGIQLEVDVPSTAWVKMEPLALQQVLLNLILNAMKALSRTDEPAIRIIAAHEGQWMIVTVEDNGPGIPKDISKKLFKPFTSIPAAKDGRKGAGLGLAVSKRLIDAAGGSVDAGRAEVGGARFTLRLPSISPSSYAKAG